MISDEARRCAESVNIHLRINGPSAIGRWVAIRLSDGGSDHNLYDSKSDAVRHQLNEFFCGYVCIPPNGMSEEDAQGWLRAMRRLYDAGFRIADPDKHVTMRPR